MQCKYKNIYLQDTLALSQLQIVVFFWDTLLFVAYKTMNTAPQMNCWSNIIS